MYVYIIIYIRIYISMFGVGGDPKTYHVSNICTHFFGHKCTEVIIIDIMNLKPN